ncbi:MAG TPA: hypothetical protein VKU85_19610, partial [bacterium]|nr:hypothetical protein [bacterium]
MPRLARRPLAAAWILLAALALVTAGAGAQDLPPDVDEEMAREALRARGMSDEAIDRALADAAARESEDPAGPDPSIPEPGRRVLQTEEAADAAGGPARPDSATTAKPATDTPGTETAGDRPADGAPDALPRFGHDLFDLAPDTFSPPVYGPIDPGYRVGPGDEVVVDVWGDVVFRLVKIVDREGGVLLPDVG